MLLGQVINIAHAIDPLIKVSTGEINKPFNPAPPAPPPESPSYNQQFETLKIGPTPIEILSIPMTHKNAQLFKDLSNGLKLTNKGNKSAFYLLKIGKDGLELNSVIKLFLKEKTCSRKDLLLKVLMMTTKSKAIFYNYNWKDVSAYACACASKQIYA